MGRHNSEVIGFGFRQRVSQVISLWCQQGFSEVKGFGQRVFEVGRFGRQQRAAVLRWSLAIILSFGTFAAIGPPSVLARNHCKDRCADRYNLRKDLCKSIPYSHERHRCESAAKHAKNQCKHDCR